LHYQTPRVLLQQFLIIRMEGHLPFKRRPFACDAEGIIQSGVSRELLYGYLSEYQKNCLSMPGCVYSHIYEIVFDEPSDDYVVRTLTVWENEGYQSENFLQDHLQETHEKVFPLLKRYPSFSFWVQMNGGLFQHVLLKHLDQENLQSSKFGSSFGECVENDLIVSYRWKSNHFRQIDSCLAQLFGLRDIAMKLQHSSTTIECKDYDLYLTHNADDPNEIMEHSIWTSRDAYNHFKELPEVRALRSQISLGFGKEPEISIWKKFSDCF